jgi:hypothetical protein
MDRSQHGSCSGVKRARDDLTADPAATDAHEGDPYALRPLPVVTAAIQARRHLSNGPDEDPRGALGGPPPLLPPSKLLRHQVKGEDLYPRHSDHREVPTLQLPIDMSLPDAAEEDLLARPSSLLDNVSPQREAEHDDPFARREQQDRALSRQNRQGGRDGDTYVRDEDQYLRSENTYAQNDNLYVRREDPHVWGENQLMRDAYGRALVQPFLSDSSGCTPREQAVRAGPRFEQRAKQEAKQEAIPQSLDYVAEQAEYVSAAPTSSADRFRTSIRASTLARDVHKPATYLRQVIENRGCRAPAGPAETFCSFGASGSSPRARHNLSKSGRPFDDRSSYGKSAGSSHIYFDLKTPVGQSSWDSFTVELAITNAAPVDHAISDNITVLQQSGIQTQAAKIASKDSAALLTSPEYHPIGPAATILDRSATVGPSAKPFSSAAFAPRATQASSGDDHRATLLSSDFDDKSYFAHNNKPNSSRAQRDRNDDPAPNPQRQPERPRHVDCPHLPVRRSQQYLQLQAMPKMHHHHHIDDELNMQHPQPHPQEYFLHQRRLERQREHEQAMQENIVSLRYQWTLALIAAGYVATVAASNVFYSMQEALSCKSQMRLADIDEMFIPFFKIAEVTELANMTRGVVADMKRLYAPHENIPYASMHWHLRATCDAVVAATTDRESDNLFKAIGDKHYLAKFGTTWSSRLGDRLDILGLRRDHNGQLLEGRVVDDPLSDPAAHSESDYLTRRVWRSFREKVSFAASIQSKQCQRNSCGRFFHVSDKAGGQKRVCQSCVEHAKDEVATYLANAAAEQDDVDETLHNPLETYSEPNYESDADDVYDDDGKGFFY